jgi:hypothetical protein
MANQMGDASEGRPSGKGKPLNSIEHKTSKSTKAWIKRNWLTAKRFKQFCRYGDLTQKKQWYAEFLKQFQLKKPHRW